MGRKLQSLQRIMIFTGRDMLIGFLLGFAAMLVLYKVNPRITGIGLLALLGLKMGLLKGLAKAILLGKLDALAHDELRKNYPKYKILSLWFIVLIGALVYSYGFDIAGWFTGPLSILANNRILNDIPVFLWGVFITAVFILGLASHYFEPTRPNFIKPSVSIEEEALKENQE